MNKSKPKLKGFTLLELIIVMAIIAIMAAVLIPNISDYMRTNKIKTANSQAQQIYMAAQDYLTSLQIKGIKTSDIADGTPIPKVCWLAVNTEVGYDSSKADNNKTTVVDTYGIKSDYVMGVIGTQVSFPIADGIEARLDDSFKGSWVVAFYPKTFTVAYAVFNDNYENVGDCLNAVELIGTNGRKMSATDCDDRLYTVEFGSASSTKLSQENDIRHPDSSEAKHLYTGQYPIPGPTL